MDRLVQMHSLSVPYLITVLNGLCKAAHFDEHLCSIPMQSHVVLLSLKTSLIALEGSCVLALSIQSIALHPLPFC